MATPACCRDEMPSERAIPSVSSQQLGGGAAAGRDNSVCVCMYLSICSFSEFILLDLLWEKLEVVVAFL